MPGVNHFKKRRGRWRAAPLILFYSASLKDPDELVSSWLGARPFLVTGTASSSRAQPEMDREWTYTPFKTGREAHKLLSQIEFGRVAKWLGNGLQIRERGFESRRDLQPLTRKASPVASVSQPNNWRRRLSLDSRLDSHTAAR